MDKAGRVLILKMSSLGDIVHALPLAGTLKKRLRGSRLGWVVERGFEDIVKNHPFVDDVFIFERRGPFFGVIKNFFLLIGRIRRKKYDIIIDLQGSMKSAAFLLMGGAPGAGFKRGSSRVDPVSTLFSGLKIEEPEGHMVERYLAFARIFGIDDYNFSAGIRIGANAARKAENFLEESGLRGKKIIMIHPGAAWSTKIWPAANYIGLIDKIHDNIPDAGVVVTAGRGEEDLGGKIQKQSARAPALAVGFSLGELAGLIDRCNIFVGSDSGPLHLAAGLDKSALGLYGPTDEIRNGPYGGRSSAVKSRRECAGCWRKTCADNGCMEDISVDDVFKELEMLNRNVQ